MNCTPPILPWNAETSRCHPALLGSALASRSLIVKPVAAIRLQRGGEVALLELRLADLFIAA